MRRESTTISLIKMKEAKIIRLRSPSKDRVSVSGRKVRIAGVDKNYR